MVLSLVNSKMCANELEENTHTFIFPICSVRICSAVHQPDNFVEYLHRIFFLSTIFLNNIQLIDYV
jgi:hypothetical protein